MSDENERARQRAGYSGQRTFSQMRKRTTVGQYTAAKQKAEWLARERDRAARITLTPEEIAEDEGYQR